ncbi:ATP-binding cassette A1 [Actinidia rufa]|uniref:ATP-binding cassette A1 n=1 Tax=Actinidia rufa TaxID=165716 RepID=A0A7J0FJ41_9ERIC|nr:ATP-binding cassette A1 [Actinidia rufa]
MVREIECCMRRSDLNSNEGSEHNLCLGIDSYGISVTTLEEVFLRVAGSDFNEAECFEEKATFVSHASMVSQASHNYTPRNILLPKLSEHYKVDSDRNGQICISSSYSALDEYALAVHFYHYYALLANNFFRLSSVFFFADGLASLALLRQGMKDGSGDGFLDWNVIDASICYLAAEGIVYYLLTLVLELVPPHKLRATIEECWRSMKIFQRSSSCYTEPLLESSSKNNILDLDEDVDVREERNRVLSGSTDNAIIYLCYLQKVYPGNYHSTKVSVHSLTFAVQKGTCFGFLGTNEQGKLQPFQCYLVQELSSICRAQNIGHFG